MTTSTTSTALTAETIAKFEAAGFRRWTKNGMDRLYIDADKLGLEVTRYANGNAKEGTWQGAEMYKQELQEIDASKIYIDIADGTLHVKTDFVPSYASDPTVESVAEAYVDAILAPEPEVEVEAEPETTDATTDERVDGKPFQHSELDAYLGDFDRDFDLDAIIDETTFLDTNGTRRWLDLDLVEFAAIVESHELRKPYQVIIEDADESCDEVLLDETFADADAAKERFAELRAEFADEDGGWRDGLNLWLFEDGESVDGESK